MPSPPIYTSPHTPSSSSFIEQRRSAGYLYYSPGPLSPSLPIYMSPYTSSSSSFMEQKRSAGYLYYSPITYTSIFHIYPQPLRPSTRTESRSKRPSYPPISTYIQERSIHTPLNVFKFETPVFVVAKSFLLMNIWKSLICADEYKKVGCRINDRVWDRRMRFL